MFHHGATEALRKTLEDLSNADDFLRVSVSPWFRAWSAMFHHGATEALRKTLEDLSNADDFLRVSVSPWFRARSPRSRGGTEKYSKDFPYNSTTNQQSNVKIKNQANTLTRQL
jgi:hypothetical protein